MSSDTLNADNKVMSFRDHLMELRKRLTRITAVLLVGFFIAWEFRIPLFEFLSRPVANALGDNGIYSFQTITLTESIVVYLKTAFIADLIILSPYVFWELWAFISPGLYSKEKRFVLPLTAFSVAFFLLGAAFAYTVLLPFLTDWLVNLTLESGNADVMVTLQNTYSFAFSFLLMFGLVFELPLVLFFLALWGAVTGKGLLKFWRYFVVISFIVAGILTPPDPLSQVFMAVPLNVLYGFGVITAFTVSRARASGRTDASKLALRAMALSMLALLALGSGLFLYITGLPQKPLTAWAPPDATFAAGMNPRVLANEKAVLGLVRAVPEAAAALDRITATTPIDDITDGIVIGLADGGRVVLLRSSGMGSAFEAAGPDVAKVDDDTVVLGTPEHVKLVAEREPERPDLGSEGDRLLRRLTLAGPLWVWIAPASPARPALIGEDNAKELASVGAALSLGERRQIVFDLPLTLDDGDGADNVAERNERTLRADRVLARIEAARVAALAAEPQGDNAALAQALADLAGELEAVASPEAKARIAAIRTRLTGPTTPHNAHMFPALSALAPYLQGVSVRREDQRLTLTAELDDEGLAAVFRLLAGL